MDLGPRGLSHEHQSEMLGDAGVAVVGQSADKSTGPGVRCPRSSLGDHCETMGRSPSPAPVRLVELDAGQTPTVAQPWSGFEETLALNMQSSTHTSPGGSQPQCST